MQRISRSEQSAASAVKKNDLCKKVFSERLDKYLESSSNPPFRFPTYVTSLHKMILSSLVIGAQAVRMLKLSARSRASFVAFLFGAANFASAQVTVTTDPVGFT